VQTLFLLKASRLSTRKKALRMSHKDVLNAEEPESNREITVAIEATDFN
jgi:hypothetical protein